MKKSFLDRFVKEIEDLKLGIEVKVTLKDLRFRNVKACKLLDVRSDGLIIKVSAGNFYRKIQENQFYIIGQTVCQFYKNEGKEIELAYVAEYSNFVSEKFKNT
jgi:hypothetical protein